MADQGKWFKLWESALDDQDLENLSIHEWFCWARLGTYMKKHGKDGELSIKAPALALQNVLRLNGPDAIKRVIKVLPGYVFEECKGETANVTNATVTFKIKCSNWSKYQGDYSTNRVRRWRKRVTPNVTAQEEKRRDVEEKRGDVSPKPPTSLPSATSTSTANGAKPAAQKKKANPWDYKVDDDEILGSEEFAKIKSGIWAPEADPETEIVVQSQGADDVF